MGPEDALKAVKFLMPKKVVPMHYSTFDMIKQDAHAWAREVHHQTGVKVMVPKPGDWIDLG
jgi:L-ascorbate metabolism protein UlaG (beta-lactamase superfamily)